MKWNCDDACVLQRQGQSCESDVSGHVSGRSPSLIAMERVMPKYASWMSSDYTDCWRHVASRMNTVSHYPALNVRGSHAFRRPAQQAAASDGAPTDDMLMTTLDSTRNQLRARLSHRSAPTHVSTDGEWGCCHSIQRLFTNDRVFIHHFQWCAPLLV